MCAGSCLVCFFCVFRTTGRLFPVDCLLRLFNFESKYFCGLFY